MFAAWTMRRNKGSLNHLVEGLRLDRLAVDLQHDLKRRKPKTLS